MPFPNSHELQRYTEKAVSIITWMEVMVGAYWRCRNCDAQLSEQFRCPFALDRGIAERCRQPSPQPSHQMPDAIIWATAQTHAMLLVTRNTKDFLDDDPSGRMPLQVVSYRNDECRSEARSISAILTFADLTPGPEYDRRSATNIDLGR